MMSPDQSSFWIKQEAQRQGFLACGIARATFLEEEAPQLVRWLQEGRHGEMAYMEKHLDKRLDPRLLVPGARSVISVLYNYAPKRDLFAGKSVKVARYAYGEDYHYVVRDRLYALLASIRRQMGNIDARVFTDSAPVHERAWAQRAGLGWIGRNTLLLRKKVGSFFFLGEIICDLVLEADAPATDHCGTCTACVDSCPTQALSLTGEMEARRCLSYLTIELREDLPVEVDREAMEGWAFGCDICQEVCPWNRFAEPHNSPRLEPLEALLGLADTCQEMDATDFRKTFGHSALNRAGQQKLAQTIKRLTGKKS